MQKKKVVIISISVAVIVLIGLLVSFLCYKKLYFTLNGPSKITLDVNNKFKDEKANACYGNVFKCHKVVYKVEGKVKNDKLGTYTLKYIVSYKNKKKVLYRTINVVDKESPKLTIEEQDYYVCPNNKIGEIKYTAFDNYDKDITDKVTKEIQGQKIILTVKDSSGNITTKSVDYIKEDKIAPIIKLKGKQTIYLLKGENYNENGYEVSDNCDDVNENVKITGKVDTTKAGNYAITYSVEDNSGNKSSIIRNIKVYEKNKTVNPGKKTIYLTFDDGPGKDTERLLDILKKYNVRATFFVTNQYPDYENMITRAYKEGHAIGLHTYTHNYSFVYASEDNYFNDLNNINEKVKRLTGGYETKLVRFPGGSSNTISRKYAPGIMTFLADKLTEEGYQYFDWNIVSGDAGETKSTEQIIKNVTSNLKDNYSIVLQHDVKSYSVDAVEEIIKYGLKNDYNFLPLDVTSPTAHQRINN